jgi:hypothetical protein
VTQTYFETPRPGSRRKAAIEPLDLSSIKVRGSRRTHEEIASSYTVLAIDPGGTTGWSIFCFDPKALVDDEVKLLASINFWTCGEVTGDEDDQVDYLETLAAAWPLADVVVEDFILRQYRQDRSLLAPVRVTASFKRALRWTGVQLPGQGQTQPRRFHLQQPNLAKSAVTDTRMRASGFYQATAGKPHARDAVRHALTFARRKKAGALFQ